MKSRQFKLVPHVADVRLSVKSKSLKQLFINALLGMNAILKKGFAKKTDRYSKTFEIKIASDDTTSLLIDFLSDVLTLSHIHKTIFYQVQFEVLAEKHLIAKIKGNKVEKFDEDVKAATYHEVEVVKDKKGNYLTNIIFDI